MKLWELLDITNDPIHIYKKKPMPFPDVHIVDLYSMYRHVLNEEILNSNIVNIHLDSSYDGLKVYLDIFEKEEDNNDKHREN